MDIAERIRNECRNKKIPFARIEKDCGFANGYIGKLQEGSVSAKRLVQIADYLSVSYDYLLTGKEKSTVSAADETLLKDFYSLNDTGRIELIKYLHMLQRMPEYKAAERGTESA